MSWEKRLANFQGEFSSLKEKKELSDADIKEYVRPILKTGTAELPETFKESGVDTLYRLAWWLTVAAEHLDEDIDLDASGDQNFIDELLEMLSQTEVNAEVTQVLDEVSSQIESASGDKLRSLVRDVFQMPGHIGGDSEDAQKTMGHLYRYLPKLLEGLEETVDEYRAGNVGDAAEMLPLLAEGIEWSVKGLLGLRNYLGQFDIDVDTEEINRIFSEVVKALEERDRVYLPDLLEYEVYPLLYNYHSRIEEVLSEHQVETSLLDKNLEALNQFNSEAGKRIEDSTETELEIEMGVADDGARFLNVSRDGESYYLSSPYAPKMEASDWADRQIKDRNYPIFVVFGFGLGYRIRALKERLPEDYTMIIAEPSAELLRSVLSRQDCSDLFDDPRIQLVVEEMEEVRQTLQTLVSWKRVGDVKASFLDNYQQLFPDAYETFVETYQRTVSYLEGQRSTVYGHAYRWVNQTIENLPEIFDARSLGVMENAFEDKPVVIVSAGPSLSKNIDHLKQIQDQAFIIAVDTAYQVLEEHNIEPHLVVVVDPEEINYETHLAETSFDKVPMAVMLRSYPEIFKRHKGKKFFLTDKQDVEVILGSLLTRADIEMQLTAFGGGSSVAHWAYQIAEFVGGEPIIFVGQDLAFTDNTRYADGIESTADESDMEGNQILNVEGSLEDEVITDMIFYTFLVQFERLISGDRRVIDATEGGAKIQGAEVMTLKEAKDAYCQESFEPSKKIDQIWSETPPVNKEKASTLFDEFGKILEDFEHFEGEFETAIELSDELIEIYENDIENITKQQRRRADQILEKLEEIDESFDENQRMSLLDLSVSAIADLARNRYSDFKHRGEMHEDPTQIAEISRFMYESFLDAFDKARPKLKQTQEKLKQMSQDA